MGLFGKPKDDRKKVKRQVDKLMKDYDKEKIDKDAFVKGIFDLSSSYQNRLKKNVMQEHFQDMVIRFCW
ncbi:MAG: hypothetical protein IJH71_05320 [Eubacterium sp.]|nr:hypothetical protein [Eubacterium sp.]